MSAWEGSAAQEQWEKERERREACIRQIQRDNPSLTFTDASEWEQREHQERQAAVKAKCCVCRSLTRAEVVRTDKGLGTCACRCHTRGDGS